MAMMQLHNIREMGEALTKARDLCQESQFDKGLALFQSTLVTLQQFIRRMNKMAERQPWLQVWWWTFAWVRAGENQRLMVWSTRCKSNWRTR